MYLDVLFAAAASHCGPSSTSLPFVDLRWPAPLCLLCWPAIVFTGIVRPHIFLGFSTLKASPCGHVRARPGIHRGMKNLSACTLPWPYSYLFVWFALRSILLLWDQKYLKKMVRQRLAQSVGCKQIGTIEFQQENHSPGADRNWILLSNIPRSASMPPPKGHHSYLVSPPKNIFSGISAKKLQVPGTFNWLQRMQSNAELQPGCRRCCSSHAASIHHRQPYIGLNILRLASKRIILNSRMLKGP